MKQDFVPAKRASCALFAFPKALCDAVVMTLPHFEKTETMKRNFYFEAAVMLNRWHVANRLKELAGDEDRTEQQQTDGDAEHGSEDGGRAIAKRGLATIISRQPEIALCHDARLQRATNAPR